MSAEAFEAGEHNVVFSERQLMRRDMMPCEVICTVQRILDDWSI